MDAFIADIGSQIARVDNLRLLLQRIAELELHKVSMRTWSSSRIRSLMGSVYEMKLRIPRDDIHHHILVGVYGN